MCQCAHVAVEPLGACDCFAQLRGPTYQHHRASLLLLAADAVIGQIGTADLEYIADALSGAHQQIAVPNL